MRSRRGIISILLLLIPQCFAAKCRTCNGKECEKGNVEFRECTKFSSILPPETYSILSNVKEKLKYGCLHLEYQNGNAIEVVQKCIITEDISTVCQNIATFIPCISCKIEPPSLKPPVEKEPYAIQHDTVSIEESNFPDSLESEIATEIAQETDIFYSDDDKTIKEEYKSKTTTEYTLEGETIENTREVTFMNYFEDQSNIYSSTPLSGVENESESLTELAFINPSTSDTHFGEATVERNDEDSSETDSTSIFPGSISEVTSDIAISTQSFFESDTDTSVSDDSTSKTTVSETTTSYYLDEDFGSSKIPMSLSDECEETTDSRSTSTSSSESDFSTIAEATVTNYLEDQPKTDSTTLATYSETEAFPDLAFISASLYDDYAESETMADESTSQTTIGPPNLMQETITTHYFENYSGTDSASEIPLESEKTTTTASSSEEDVTNNLEDGISSSSDESTTKSQMLESTTAIDYSENEILLPDFIHIIVSDHSDDEINLENTQPQTTSADYLEGHSETDSFVNYDTTSLSYFETEIIADSVHTTVALTETAVDDIETTSETTTTSESVSDSTREMADKELITESFPDSYSGGTTQFLPEETFGITTEELLFSSQSSAEYSTISIITDNSYTKTTVLRETEASVDSEELITSTTELYFDSVPDEVTTSSYQIATSDLDDTNDSSTSASTSNADSVDDSNSVLSTKLPSNAMDSEFIKLTTTKEPSVPLIDQEVSFTQPESTDATEDPSGTDNDNNCNSASKTQFSFILCTMLFVIYVGFS